MFKTVAWKRWMLCDRSHINEYVTNYRYFKPFYKGVNDFNAVPAQYDCRIIIAVHYGDDANSRANADVFTEKASIVLLMIILGPWFKELTTLILRFIW